MASSLLQDKVSRRRCLCHDLSLPKEACLEASCRELPRSFSAPFGPWLKLTWERLRMDWVSCSLILGPLRWLRGSFPKLRPIASEWSMLHAYCKLSKRKPKSWRDQSSATMLSSSKLPFLSDKLSVLSPEGAARHVHIKVRKLLLSNLRFFLGGVLFLKTRVCLARNISSLLQKHCFSPENGLFCSFLSVSLSFSLVFSRFLFHSLSLSILFLVFFVFFLAFLLIVSFLVFLLFLFALFLCVCFTKKLYIWKASFHQLFLFFGVSCFVLSFKTLFLILLFRSFSCVFWST